MTKNRFKRTTSLALAFALLLSLLPMALPKAGAASSESTLASVTETYVDASDGSKVSKDETYSVTHKEKNPQKIADYTYQDYTESVERVYSHKDISYIYGYPDKTVRPDNPMTRAEAAAVFYRLYDGSYPALKRGMSAKTFSDLDASFWCYKEIELLYNIGMINGYGDGTFRPNDPITRAEFATLAAQWAGLDYSGDVKFSDVTTNHWAYGIINAAAAAGWVDGYPDGTFKPDQDIARVEVMKLVNRMVNRSITVEELTKLGAVNPYTDLVDTHWGYSQVMEATIPHSGAEWHGTNYNDGKLNVIIETFVDTEGNELAKSVVSAGKEESTTKEVPGYNYLGYIRHVTYVYNKGAASPYITKSANVDETYEGKDIEYTVTAGNKKDAHAAWKSVVITDQLPDGVKLVDGSVYLNKKSAEYTLKDGTLSVRVGDIAEGKEAAVTFKVTVQKGMAGKIITNTAVATGDNGTAEDTSYTATDKGVSINQGTISPSVKKTANTSSASVGDRVTYTIVASNGKNATYQITDAVISDEIPAGMVLREGSVQVGGSSAAYAYDEDSHLLSISLGDIAPGTSVKVSFATDVNKSAYGKTIKNVAVLSGSNIPDTSDEDDGIVIAAGETQPTLTKRANKFEVDVGDTITYTITASNSKNATAAIENGTITDTLPQGMDFKYGSVQVNGKNVSGTTYDEESRTLTVPVGEIAAGTSVKVTFAVTVTKDAYGSAIKNVAVLTSDNGPDTEAEDPGVNVNDGKTRPTLTKEANKTTAEVGDTVTYTITAGNTETAAVAIENGIVTDILPQGLEFRAGSVQVNGKSVSGISYNDDTRTLVVPVGEIGIDSSVKVTFMAEITKGAYGKTIKNVAILSSNNGPDVKAEDPGVNVGDGKAKPTIEKSSNKKEASVGDRIEYTLTVGNEATATVALENPVITDVIPSGLDFVDGSVYIDGKTSKDYNYSDTDHILTINLESIEPDSTVTVKFSTKVNDSAYDSTIQNLATLTSDNGDRKQDTDDGVKIPDGRAQLNLTKTADNRTPKVGERVTYTMKVGNVAGAPVPARDVQIADTIPEGLTFTGVVQIDSYSATYGYQNGKLVIPVGDIAPGYIRTVTAEFIVNESAYGKTITNVAVASADNAEDKPAADAGINVPEGTPDGYAAQKTVSKSNAKVGDTLTYSFRLGNTAGATAAWENATITDTIPEGLTFQANVNMNGASTTNYAWDEDSRTIVMTAPSIEAGKAVTFSFDVSVDEGMQSKFIVNTATVKGPDGQPDIPISDPGVNVDPGMVEPYSSKSSDKTEVNVGETIVYTVEVGNRSSATATWKDVVMTDILPDGVRLLNSVSCNGAPVAFTVDNNVLTTRLGNILAGEKLTVKYEVLVLPEAAGSTLRNTVTLNGSSTTTQDPTPPVVPPTDPKPGSSGNDWDIFGDVYVEKDVDKITVKVGPDATTADKRVTYTVLVGNDTADKALWENVVLTDVLDDGLMTLVDDTIYVDGIRLNANKFTYRNDCLTIELGDVPYGKEIEVKFTVEFKPDAANRSFKNVAAATGTIDGEKFWANNGAPIVTILDSNGASASGKHYAMFHGFESGLWIPDNKITLEQVALLGYRILTNDYQLILQKSGNGYVSDYLENVCYYDEVRSMVRAGIFASNEFEPSAGMVEGKDYRVHGDGIGNRQYYEIYATRDQIGRMLTALFGSNYGISGSGHMIRIDVAKLLCQIQGRDTDPNWQSGMAAGMAIAQFPDVLNNALVVEVSNTHSYTIDSYGNETWVLNDKLY